jgi:hypothetical protein
MKYLKMILFFLIVFFTIELNAQIDYEEVVYLKNGTVIRGLIIEQVPKQSIKIQTKDRNIFVFNYVEIEKITKELISTPLQIQDENPRELVVHKKKMLKNYTEINYSQGIGNIKTKRFDLVLKNNEISYGIKTSFGCQFYDKLFLGISLGVNKHNLKESYPLTAEFRYKFIKKKFSPLISANFGYSLMGGRLNKGLNVTSIGNALKDGIARGGMIINLQVGIIRQISEKIGYVFNVGFRSQVQEVKTLFVTDQAMFKYFTVSTGFSF